MTTVSETSSSPATTGSTATSSLSASYEMFLQLLCTQLENQDPLDPMDSSEFTNQLVLYSTLEQQINTNDKLDDVLSSIDSYTASSAVAYLGKTVTAEGDTIAVEEGDPATWIYELDAKADEVELTITDAKGKTVWTGTGEIASGSHTLTWDGTDKDGNPVDEGEYTLTVSATDADGEDLDTTTYVQALVTGVDTSGDSAVLSLNGIEFDIDDVVGIAL